MLQAWMMCNHSRVHYPWCQRLCGTTWTAKSVGVLYDASCTYYCYHNPVYVWVYLSLSDI